MKIPLIENNETPAKQRSSGSPIELQELADLPHRLVSLDGLFKPVVLVCNRHGEASLTSVRHRDAAQQRDQRRYCLTHGLKEVMRESQILIFHFGLASCSQNTCPTWLNAPQ